MKHLILFFSIFLSTNLFSQSFTIKGIVIDGKTKETIPGAIIIIDSTGYGNNTNMNGEFVISNVPFGTYKGVTCKYISYNNATIGSISCNTDSIIVVNFEIFPQSKQLTEVVIMGEPSKETISALLIQQKNSASVSDGITTELIKRTPDRSSSDVLKRISGTTIQDNKFAIVRGLNDRYNAAFINGTPLPSTESDRKAFSFDIVPSNLLDNIIILKSATPNLPAEFAGGIIQINTKSIPEESFQQLSIGAGYNNLATGKDFLTYKGGKTDWLGIDDGTRAMPSFIPAKQVMDTMSNFNKGELAKKMNNDWALSKIKALPNLNGQYSFGYLLPFKNSSHQLGVTGSLTYSKSNKLVNTIRQDYLQASTDIVIKDFIYNDTEYSTQVLAGALLNFEYKYKNKLKLAFKNLGNINADNRVISRNGFRDVETNNPIEEESNVRWFTSNILKSSQVQGEYNFEKQKIKLKAIVGESTIDRNIPNLRRDSYNVVRDSLNEGKAIYTANIADATIGPSYNGNMLYAKTLENINSISFDASKEFTINKLVSTISSGYYFQGRDRSFESRNLGYSIYRKNAGGIVSFNDSLLSLPIDQIFSTQNMGEIKPFVKGYFNAQGQIVFPIKGLGGFKLEDGTKLADSYDAESTLNAIYLMLDNKWKDKIRLIWGVRMEKFNQVLNSLKDDGSELVIDSTITDFLPSANAVFSVNEKTNLRFGYYKTLNRPEYRELAPFVFYDFSTNLSTSGNANLQRAIIHNFDLRYESFLGFGQSYSVSVFYKKFLNAIETVNREDAVREIYYQNVNLATNIGFEFEFRSNLAKVLKQDDNKLLSCFQFFGNVSLIKSSVDVSSVKGAGMLDRPLQGQSPYIINGGLQFTSVNRKFTSSLNVNQVGRRIAFVGNKVVPNIWEKERLVFDAQIGYSILKNRLDFRFNVKDMLAQDFILYQDVNNNNKFESTDNLMVRANNARILSFSIVYKIK